MHLLDNIATEVYKAYFPQSLAATEAVDIEAADGGSEQNYKKWPPSEISPFFPKDKIVADDPYWNQYENCPPTLAARCIQTLARFFSVKPEAGCCLTGGDRAKFLNLLSTKESILMTAEKIPDEIYWKRCCNDLLSNSDVSLHGGSYKRLFLERHLQKNIESFVPQQTDLFDIKDLLNVMEPYIKRLEITELLPPTLLIYPGREEDNLEDLDDDEEEEGQEGEEGDETAKEPTTTSGGIPSILQSQMESSGMGGPSLPPELNMKTPANHFDFGTIFPQLTALEELHLCYKVKNCGIDFRWNMFGMTSKDAENLALGLKICKKIKVLRINNSKIDDDKFYQLVDGFRVLSQLEVLKLPFNTLTDDAMSGLVKLMNEKCHVRVLDLTNNKISNQGAKHLATYLESGVKIRLEILLLGLNVIGDDGCLLLANAIANNNTLHTLDISSNKLSQSSGLHLKNMIMRSPSLRDLNVACNPLNVDGGFKVLEGVNQSNRILKLDVRLTGCGREVDMAIQQAIKKNRLQKVRPPTLSSSSRSSSPSGFETPAKPKTKYPYPKL